MTRVSYFYERPAREEAFRLADVVTGKWRVHLVYPGEGYGRNESVIYEAEHAEKYGMGLPLVEFYDTSQDEDKFPGGQFVSSYYMSTLLGLDGWGPDVRGRQMLVLDGEIPGWTVYKGDLAVIADALWEIHAAIKPDEKAHGLDADISVAKTAADLQREQRDENQQARPGKGDREF